jgi:predicted amidohydrolase
MTAHSPASEHKSETGLKVALSQTPGCFGDPKAALSLLASEAARAKAEGVDILLLPEMFLTGYNLGKTLARTLAGEVAGDILDQARQVARDHGVALVFGYPELVGDKVANAAMFVGADGELLLNYRKAHLYGDLDRQMFQVRGDVFPVFTYHGWKIGLMICYDTEFPEPARLLALQGAEVILVPTALMKPYGAVPHVVVPARGYENQLYIAYANHSGAEGDVAYIGRSCICGPDGAVLASAGTDAAFISAVFEKAHIVATKANESLLDDRRPDLYRNLAR